LKGSIFIIGGCRSGKSSHALELAGQSQVNKKLFIATCVPNDKEMEKRVERHKRERSRQWETLETPVGIPDAITDNSPTCDVILVDCLTLWISNLFFEKKEMDEISDHVQRLTHSIKTAKCPVIIVSNEVGTGIVPENSLARHFRDVVGFANQNVAKSCDRVIWMVAGIPVQIK